jgi:hypothetical protein
MVLVVAVVMLVHVPVDPARGLARVDIGDCILFRKLEDDKEIHAGDYLVCVTGTRWVDIAARHTM